MTHQQALSTSASERYLLGEMTEPERSTFEEHYFSCTECAEDVRTLAVMQEGVREGFLSSQSRATSAVGRSNVLTMPQPARRWYQSTAIPWALAATLALTAGYQTLIRGPQPQGQAELQAFTPIALRPASRGQDPIIHLPANFAPIALAVDVIGAEGAEVIYDLRTAEGARVLSGRTAAPPSGSPLVLLIPARSVNPPGHYVLAVSGTEYRFEVVSR
jgi:hypothetical protein